LPLSILAGLCSGLGIAALKSKVEEWSAKRNSALTFLVEASKKLEDWNTKSLAVAGVLHPPFFSPWWRTPAGSLRETRMDAKTIIEIVISLLIGLGTGLTIKPRKKKTVMKGRDDSTIATETKGDVMQSKQGAITKTENKYFGPTLVLYNVDPKTPISPQAQEKIKNAYLNVAEDLKAPDSVIDLTRQVAETSSGSFGMLSIALPYVTGTIAQATGNEEDEIAERIIRQADLENYFQFIGEWECSQCHHENLPDARYCSSCGSPRVQNWVKLKFNGNGKGKGILIFYLTPYLPLALLRRGGTRGRG
jgi:hypothetical protein